MAVISLVTENTLRHVCVCVLAPQTTFGSSLQAQRGGAGWLGPLAHGGSRSWTFLQSDIWNSLLLIFISVSTPLSATWIHSEAKAQGRGRAVRLRVPGAEQGRVGHLPTAASAEGAHEEAL